MSAEDIMVERSQGQEGAVPSLGIKDSLPRLPYKIVLEILRLAKAHYLERRHFVILRGIGEAWRLAIDNFYLPFSHEPASAWGPYLQENLPGDVLGRSKGKHFMFPHDTQLFQEMCNCPHNPFPTRELKILCSSSSFTRCQQQETVSSLSSISNHIWSLTYVVGPTRESVILLFQILDQMPYLEDLRVIDFFNPLNSARGGKPLKFPHLKTVPFSQHRLSSLSVTGSDKPSILDELLELYGSGKLLKCLEMQGGAVKKSKFLGKRSDFLVGITKLKIVGGSNETINKLRYYQPRWKLTHITFHMGCRGTTPIVSEKLPKWLENFRYSLQVLRLYFNDTWETEREIPFRKVALKRRMFTLFTSYYRLRKLGLPFRFVGWDCWNYSNCKGVEEIEFHDWYCTVDKERREVNAEQISEEEKQYIYSAVKRYWCLSRLRIITVCYGKSNENSIQLKRSEVMDSDDEW